VDLEVSNIKQCCDRYAQRHSKILQNPHLWSISVSQMLQKWQMQLIRTDH